MYKVISILLLSASLSAQVNYEAIGEKGESVNTVLLTPNEYGLLIELIKGNDMILFSRIEQCIKDHTIKENQKGFKVKELKLFAKDRGIDLGNAKKEVDIIEALMLFYKK